VRKTVAILLGPFSTLLLLGCETGQVDQIAQQRMIGLSRGDVLACLGKPAGRVAVGDATQIWTYAGGQTRGYGPQWTIFLNTNLPPFAWPGACEVRVVMTNGRVGQVGYAADGGPLPLGEVCVFPVERCVRAP
jgi:hypothetical protein